MRRSLTSAVALVGAGMGVATQSTRIELDAKTAEISTWRWTVDMILPSEKDPPEFSAVVRGRSHMQVVIAETIFRLDFVLRFSGSRFYAPGVRPFRYAPSTSPKKTIADATPVKTHTASKPLPNGRSKSNPSASIATQTTPLKITGQLIGTSQL